jgi:hypothetical protein
MLFRSDNDDGNENRGKDDGSPLCSLSIITHESVNDAVVVVGKAQLV